MPPTSTTHTRQMALAVVAGCTHTEGTSDPAARAASRMVVPGATLTGVPSMVRVT